jgi:acetyltransferase
MHIDPGDPRPADELDRWQAPDGTEIAIRPLRSDDAAPELRFIESLSSQTRYERTFSHRKGLEPGELRALIRFDVREEVALAAVVPGAAGDEFAGVARLKKSPDGERFEFAIVVADRWQRRGVGLRLLGKLVEVARRAGIPRIEGCTFATNEAMKALARRAGFGVRADPDDASLTLLDIDL